jgi:hypothetical protein
MKPIKPIPQKKLQPAEVRPGTLEYKVNRLRGQAERDKKKYNQFWDDDRTQPKFRLYDKDAEHFSQRNRSILDTGRTIGRLQGQSAKLAALKKRSGNK